MILPAFLAGHLFRISNTSGAISQSRLKQPSYQAYEMETMILSITKDTQRDRERLRNSCMTTFSETSERDRSKRVHTVPSACCNVILGCSISREQLKKRVLARTRDKKVEHKRSEKESVKSTPKMRHDIDRKQCRNGKNSAKDKNIPPFYFTAY